MDELEYNDLNEKIIEYVGVGLIETSLKIFKNANTDKMSLDTANKILKGLPKVRDELANIKDGNKDVSLLLLVEEVEKKYDRLINPDKYWNIES